MPADNRCPRCGAAREPGSPASHCPRCLLRLGFGADLSVGSHGEPSRTVGLSRSVSALTVLEGSIGPVPRVLLRDTEAGPETPVVRPVPAAATIDPTGRYQLLGEIARGGMGAILKGRDTDLGRDLAVKVLLEQHRDKPDLVRRFVEEAQIGGQLQHPGIVPVYELGTLPDRRPFFSMKLVKGRTLAALLDSRRDPADDRPRLLGIFEQVCQTLAYAHARGVIHRDLKPSNVMVGAFGEVQVMDWGLAKVLVAGGSADDERSMHRSAESVIQTVRSGSDADASLAGSVLGTPAYMAPEQARGEIEWLDERADVFGLGAILCEILTGQPPYLGRHQGEIQRLAARADLDDALTRLDASLADPELLGLARRCLAAEPRHRPRDAGEVALAVRQYLNGVQERLHRAEVTRAEALARAEEEAKRRLLADELAREARAHAAEERKRRRMTVALAASVLLTVALGGAGWARFARDRAAREEVTAREVNKALDEAAGLRGQARSARVGDLTEWAAADASARRAEALLNQGGAEADLRSRVRSLLAAIAREFSEAKAAAESAARDRRMVERLDEIRADVIVQDDPTVVEGLFQAAFHEYGIDVDALGPKEAARRIVARPIAAVLASALDDWAIARRRKDLSGARRLTEAAKVADPDPWNNRLRDVILIEPDDRKADPDAVKKLAADVDMETLPIPAMHHLGLALSVAGDRETATSLLRVAQRRQPNDFRVNSEFGETLFNLGQEYWDEALRFKTAAVAARPRSAYGHARLGYILSKTGRLEEAAASLREAVRLKPGSGRSHGLLARVLVLMGAGDEARAEIREAERVEPDNPETHFWVAITLWDLGEEARSIAEHREAIRLRPNYVVYHHNLGQLLLSRQNYQDAAAELREAVRCRPGLGVTHSDLGEALLGTDAFEEAYAQFREAVRLWPNGSEAHNNLGGALERRGNRDEAITEYRQALRLNPKNFNALVNLALALKSEGKFVEALGAILRTEGLAARDSDPGKKADALARACERLVGLDARLPAVLRGDDAPVGADECVEFASLCFDKHLVVAAARLWSEAFGAKPELANDRKFQHRYNAACAAALAGSGKGKDDPPTDEDAMTALRRQALDWLRAEQAAWAKLLESGSSEERTLTRNALQHCQRLSGNVSVARFRVTSYKQTPIGGATLLKTRPTRSHRRSRI